MAEGDYLMQIYQGKKQKARRENPFQSRKQDYGPILDEYASLRKNKNPRADRFYMMHRKHLDDIIKKLSGEISALRASELETDKKRLLRLDKKYRYLF